MYLELKDIKKDIHKKTFCMILIAEWRAEKYMV